MENNFILITDKRIIKLLVHLVKKSSICFRGNIPNLAAYSTHTRTIERVTE